MTHEQLIFEMASDWSFKSISRSNENVTMRDYFIQLMISRYSVEDIAEMIGIHRTATGMTSKGLRKINFKYMRKIIEKIKAKFSRKPLLVIPDVSESCINFAIWVQDNYSQNKKANTHDMLPKGQMRKDFTNDIYTMAEICQHYNSR